MLVFVGPGILLSVALAGILTWHYGSSASVLSRRSPAQREDLLNSFRGRSYILLTAALALLCAVGAVRSIWSGDGAWWLWLIALAAHVGVHFSRERAARRVYAYLQERPTPRTRHERVRERYVLLYGGIGVLAFIGAEVVLPDPGSGEAATRTVVAAILLVLALLAAAAAGWAAVWVYKTDDAENKT